MASRGGSAAISEGEGSGTTTPRSQAFASPALARDHMGSAVAVKQPSTDRIIRGQGVDPEHAATSVVDQARKNRHLAGAAAEAHAVDGKEASGLGSGLSCRGVSGQPNDPPLSHAQCSPSSLQSSIDQLAAGMPVTATAQACTSHDAVLASPPAGADLPRMKITARQASSMVPLVGKKVQMPSRDAAAQGTKDALGDQCCSPESKELQWDGRHSQNASVASQPSKSHHLQIEVHKAGQTANFQSDRPQPKHLARAARPRSSERPMAPPAPQLGCGVSAHEPSPAAPTSTGGAGGSPMMKLLEEDEEQHLCISCLEQLRQILFIPCGHILHCRQVHAQKRPAPFCDGASLSVFNQCTHIHPGSSVYALNCMCRYLQRVMHACRTNATEVTALSCSTLEICFQQGRLPCVWPEDQNAHMHKNVNGMKGCMHSTCKCAAQRKSSWLMCELQDGTKCLLATRRMLSNMSTLAPSSMPGTYVLWTMIGLQYNIHGLDAVNDALTLLLDLHVIGE